MVGQEVEIHLGIRKWIYLLSLFISVHRWLKSFWMGDGGMEGHSPIALQSKAKQKNLSQRLTAMDSEKKLERPI